VFQCKSWITRQSITKGDWKIEQNVAHRNRQRLSLHSEPHWWENSEKGEELRILISFVFFSPVEKDMRESCWRLCRFTSCRQTTSSRAGATS
jgi:hypothetical protein